MYDFIFFFIYSQQMIKGRDENFSRWNGAIVSVVAFMIHTMLILVVIDRFLLSGSRHFINTAIETVKLFVVPLLLLSGFYYNPHRLKQILEKNQGNLYILNTIQIIKILLLIFGPMILIFVLASGKR
ncbi:MAG: hypothetical protein JST87_03925 [Bacteroidetes bacterium]|nr:hypothetical protein [Bacteroidota bacterium]